MPRRVSLPGAAELFRATPDHPTPDHPGPDHPGSDHPGPDRPGPEPTGREPIALGPAGPARTEPEPSVAEPEPSVAEPPAEPPSTAEPASPADRRRRSAGRGTGRVRHDEKITVYVSGEELLDLERARLSLRAEHGMAVDRGRIVREALALVIGDLADRGADSDLVRRLSQS